MHLTREFLRRGVASGVILAALISFPIGKPSHAGSCLGGQSCTYRVEIEPISESCFDLTMTEFCGSILGPYFCMMTCWATFCVYSSSWLYTGGCLGPACLEG